MLYAGQLSQVLAIGPTKIAIVLFYRRIFSGHAFNIISYTLIVLAGGWIIAFLFGNMLQCMPLSLNWILQKGQKPTCIHLSMSYAQVYLDVSLDCLIMVAPIPFGKKV